MRKELTELKAIRINCFNCQGWDGIGTKPRKAVHNCQNTDCVFWRFRIGHRPKKEKSDIHIAINEKDDLTGRFIQKKRKKLISETGSVTVFSNSEKMTIEIEKNKSIPEFSKP